MHTLLVMQGRDRGQRFAMADDVITLGRESTCTIQLHDSEVSRKHCELRRDAAGNVKLTDLGSSNGTYLNGQAVKETVLQSGDRIQLGRTLLLFSLTQAASDNPQLVHQVDIISRDRARDESQIVKTSLPPDSSQVMAFPEASDSPWLSRARSNLQIMYRTALAVSQTLDIDQLLQRILEMIFDWVEADRGVILLKSNETGELEPAASRNRNLSSTQERFAISRTILDYVLQNKQGVHTSDAGEDNRWNSAQSIVSLGVREAICVPMQGRYGIVGVIYIDTSSSTGQLLEAGKATKFSEDHLKLMVAIGHQAALAVEDTSYYSALVQAERLAAMGQTIATLSHHIKNILQGISGGSYLIEAGLKSSDNEVVRKGWRIVEKNQERISSLVMDMLTFSKERRPELKQADPCEVVEDVIELMQSRAAEALVDLQWTKAESLPPVQLDADLLQRAVLNVVSNAIDACEKLPGRHVTVRLAPGKLQKSLEIIVEDDGEGIPLEDQRKIFSVFESRKGARGTGLGLPVSQKIMREHGGDVLLESTPGVGSRFILWLPAAPQATPQPAFDPNSTQFVPFERPRDGA